jgi:hypothetical protein
VARNDKDEAQAEATDIEDKDSGKAAEDDGYRRTRRLRDEAAPGGGAGAGKAGKDDKPKGPEKPKGFVEQHWDSWLSQVLMLGAVGVIGLGYMWDLFPESFTTLCLVAAVVLAAIYTTAWPAMDLIKDTRWRALFGVLVAVWAVSAAYPPLRKIKPRQVVGEVAIPEVGNPVKVPIKGDTGPFDITVSGKLNAEGMQGAEAGYTLTVATASAKETVEGKLEYTVGQARSRRGTSHWTQRHDQKVHALSSQIKGSELTITADEMDSLYKEGLHVRVHPQDLILRVVQPFNMGSFDLPLCGILVFLLMLVVESRIGDSTTKTYLGMAAAVTTVFATDFYTNATSVNLMRPAIGALFNALVFGGIGGTLLGWIVRRVSGRSKIKPAKPNGKGEGEG